MKLSSTFSALLAIGAFAMPARAQDPDSIAQDGFPQIGDMMSLGLQFGQFMMGQMADGSFVPPDSTPFADMAPDDGRRQRKLFDMSGSTSAESIVANSKSKSKGGSKPKKCDGADFAIVFDLLGLAELLDISPVDSPLSDFQPDFDTPGATASLSGIGIGLEFTWSKPPIPIDFEGDGGFLEALEDLFKYIIDVRVLLSLTTGVCVSQPQNTLLPANTHCTYETFYIAANIFDVIDIFDGDNTSEAIENVLFNLSFGQIAAGGSVLGPFNLDPLASGAVFALHPVYGTSLSLAAAVQGGSNLVIGVKDPFVGLFPGEFALFASFIPFSADAACAINEQFELIVELILNGFGVGGP